MVILKQKREDRWIKRKWMARTERLVILRWLGIYDCCLDFRQSIKFLKWRKGLRLCENVIKIFSNLGWLGLYRCASRLLIFRNWHFLATWLSTKTDFLIFIVPLSTLAYTSWSKQSGLNKGCTSTALAILQHS